VKNQSKNVDLPDFTYIDAKVHPKHRDHLVVLSKNDFPKNKKMTYCYATPFYDISGLDYDEKFKTHFEAAVIEKENEEAAAKKAKAQKRTASAWTDEYDEDDDASYRSPNLNNADELIKASQDLGFDDDDSSDVSSDYEGGSSDEEEKKNNKKGSKKDLDKSVDELEEELNSITGSDKKKANTTRKTPEEEKDSDNSESVDSKSKTLKKKDKSKTKKIDEESEDEQIKVDKNTEDEKSESSKKNDPTSIPNETSVKDTNEVPKDEEEEEKKEEEQTFKDRFLKLSQESKQYVVDVTVEKAVKAVEKDVQYGYHGYKINESIEQGTVCERFAIPGYEVPEAEKPKLENQTYQPSGYGSHNARKKFEGIEYRPLITREVYQLSLWRVDGYT
jgi:hypothetical protein